MTYYIFNIDPIYKKVNSDYELFSYLKLLCFTKDNSIKKEISYNNLIRRISPNLINKNIKKKFNNNHSYNYNHSMHSYNNRYLDEYFSLRIGKSLLLLKCNRINRELLQSLDSQSLFACDFDNQNYFWTNEFGC